MLKICIVTHSYPRFTGDYRSNFIELLAHAYARAGAAVTVFTPYTPLFDRPTAEVGGVRIVTFRYAPFTAWHTIGYGHSMVGDLDMHPVDLLLMPFLLLFGTLRLAALLRNQGFDLLHAHWAVPNTLIALWARALARSPAKVFTAFPGSDVAVITRLGWLGRQLVRIIGRSDYLSCDGADLAEDVVHAGMQAGRIDFVIYGVDENAIHFSEEERLRLRQRLAISPDQIVLLMIGRFVAKKGFETGFEALKHIAQAMPSIQMIVVGDGPLQSRYLEILQQDGTASRVRFVGTISTEELYKYYSACDVFLMPSRRLPSHGLNVVVPEAMACGRPIVASNVGGNTIVVRPGVNGYLHDEGDAVQLARFTLALAADAALREEMGQASLRLVRERFNWDAIARTYLQKLEQAAGAAEPAPKAV